MSELRNTPSAPAGWYSDPHGLPQQRWWTGDQWTHAVAPAPHLPARPPQVTPQPAPRETFALPATPSAHDAMPTRRQLREQAAREAALLEHSATPHPAAPFEMPATPSVAVPAVSAPSVSTPPASVPAPRLQPTIVPQESYAAAGPTQLQQSFPPPAASQQVFVPPVAAPVALTPPAATFPPPVASTVSAPAFSAPALSSTPLASAPVAASPKALYAGLASPALVEQLEPSAPVTPATASYAGAFAPQPALASSPAAPFTAPLPAPLPAWQTQQQVPTLTTPPVIAPAVSGSQPIAGLTSATSAPAPARELTAAPALAPSDQASWPFQTPPGAGFDLPTDMPYKPFGMKQSIKAGVAAPPDRVQTGEVWAIALLPLAIVAAGLALVSTIPEFYTSFMQIGLLFVFALITVILAVRDRRTLLAYGHTRTANPGWIVLTPLVYLLVRSSRARGSAGRESAPLLVWLLVVAIITGAAFAFPDWVAKLIHTSALF